MKIDPNFFKAYYRKALALRELPHIKGADFSALETIKKGLEVDPNSVELLDLLGKSQTEVDLDWNIPEEDPERVRFENLFRWMKRDGSEFDKLKVRYYSPDYRGVHAARDIAKGETILYVPK